MSRIRDYIAKRLFGLQHVDPEKAYDLWSANYDQQPDNVILALDEKLVTEFLDPSRIKGKVVLDIGCGTGRHWPKILVESPTRLVGFDVSEGMLAKLREKFPKAEVRKVENNLLTGIEKSSADYLISTLALAHIEDVVEALTEWDRVLKPGGELIITDYHPEALAKGAHRTFNHGKRQMAVKSFVHPVEEVQALARQLHWQIVRFTEKRIDESVKHFYEKQNALPIYERYQNFPIIYGLHLKKADAAE